MKLVKTIKDVWLCICEAIQRVFSADRPARKTDEKHQTIAEGGSNQKTEGPEVNDSPTQGNSKSTPVETTSGSPNDPKSGEAKENDNAPAKPTRRPGQRGGKPKKNTAKKPKAKQPYCDLICMEGHNKQWSIAVSVPKGCDVLSVRQNGKDLPTNGNGRHYVLEDICCDVVVKFEEDKEKSIILSDEKRFRIFKTKQNWEGIGRKVKTVSSGYYVVFADEACGNRTGSAPIHPEPCRYPSFMTHFFQITDENSANGFENCSFASPQKRFSLKGDCIYNDANGGTLFIGDAPRLNDTEGWKGVSWVMVGKEDSDDVLEEFKGGEKDITDILKSYKNGWFFIRIYDDETSLLHSMDFRWVKNLQAVHVDGNPNWQDSPIVPSKSGGHSETKVEFKGEISVSSVDSPHIRKTGHNVFAVSPHPDGDRIKWMFKSNEEETESTMILPRIWFKFEDEGQENADWQDKPVKMKREKFRRAKDKNVHIRVPLSVKKARVGFDNLDQVFTAKLCEDRKTKNIDFQLGNFVDYLEIENPLHERIALRAQLDTNNITVPIIYILADDDTINPPIAYVMRGAGAFRTGKGFSRRELQEANLPNDTAICCRIKRDRRRRTAHRQNIQALIMYNKEYDAQQK